MELLVGPSPGDQVALIQPRFHDLDQFLAQIIEGVEVGGIHNTQALGEILYTRYVYLFESAGLILLVAMIGTIVLTLHHKRDVRRQSIAAQVGRTREEGVKVVKVETGKGLK